MIRAKFYIKFKDCGNDYRPVKWPIKYPYWCTGESDRGVQVVLQISGRLLGGQQKMR